MTTTVDQRDHRAARERASIEALIPRLSGMFPDLEPEVVERTVTSEYAEFDDSAIRDFVPVLVERRARARLQATPQPRHRA